MRQPALVVFTIASALAIASPSCAQDAGKIIDQFLKAAGGSKAIARVQTLSLDGGFSDGGEKSGTYTFRVKQPNRYYTELRTEGQTLIEAYNGKSAWHETAGRETSTLLGEQALQVEATAQYYNSRLRELGKKKIGVVFKGRAQVHGKDTLEVELTYATGIVWDIYFDAQSHLIVEEKAIIAGSAREIYYDDYRTVDGLKLPYKLELHRGNDIFDITITRAAINETVGERVFDFPRKSQVQLPDLKKLFEEIDANQKEIDKIKENYTGTRVEEETEYDKSGKITRRRVEEYTFFYLHGQEVSTLVKKDGRPLSREEQKKEDEQTRKRIDELQKEEKKKEAKEAKAKEEGKQGKENDEPGIETFLRVCQFVNPRHERFRGQEVLVFDFEPNPEYKPKNLVEHVVKELAGVVWVDEKAHDVARLEAYFVGDMRIGGFLVNLQKGTSFIMEQAYLNNEVWLPTYEEVHAGARVLLVKGFKINEVTTYSGYKRFNVEILNTINKPKAGGEGPAKPQ